MRALDHAGNADQSAASFEWSIDTTAPQTQIDTHPPALTNSANANLSFSGSDTGGSGVASLECRRDSSNPADWASCTSPQSYSGLSDGAHKFEVRAVDQAGNADQSAASFEWSIDTTPPQTQIDSSPSALTNSANASFSFSGTDAGGSGVASFECRRDSEEWVSCASPRTYTSLAEGAHSFEVRAVDQAGNTDQSPATFNWSIDTIAPNTTIDTHPSALSNSASANFSFSGTDTGGSGVGSFQCRRDSSNPADWTACGSPQSYSSLADGAHKFEVRAVDNAGNADQSAASFEWTVDSAAPSSPQLTATVPASPANDNSPKVVGSAPAGTTVRLYTGADCSGSPIATVTPAELEAGFEVTVPGDSTTTFSATAVTAAENTSGCSEPLTYVEDSSGPQTQIDTNPQALTTATTADFTFSGSDNGGSGVASFQCRRDSSNPADWASCSSPEDYSALSDGAHTFEVRAVDQAGNIDQSPATFNWSIDTVAPNTTIDSSPSALSNSANANFGFTGSDTDGSGVASFQCRRDSTEAADWASCSSPQGYTSLSDGSHKFEVRAVDQAGNADQSAASFEWSIDTVAPQAPQLSATVPASPANDNNPVVVGSAPAGATVRLYTDATCSGSPIATVTPAELEAGVEVTVPDDSTTTFRATATTTAANTSGCSGAISYLEDSNAPETTIDSSPPVLSHSDAASFDFSATDDGSGLASFECRLDSEAPGGWTACTSPQAYASLVDGSHKFEARGIDAAGNVDPSSASFQWAIDTSSPPTEDESPSAARFLRVKRNVSKGTALLFFEVTGPGQLSVHAPKLSAAQSKNASNDLIKLREQRLRLRRIKPLTLRVARPGQVKLPVSLAPAGRTLLQKEGSLKVKVVSKFTSPDKSSATWKLTVTLKKLSQNP